MPAVRDALDIFNDKQLLLLNNRCQYRLDEEDVVKSSKFGVLVINHDVNLF